MGKFLQTILVRLGRPFRLASAVGWLMAGLLPVAVARSDSLTLRDGRQIEGKFTSLNTMVSGQGAAPAPATKLIIMADDGLRRTYFPKKLVKPVAQPAPPGPRLEEIDVPQPVAVSGQRIGGVGAFLKIAPFDKHGHRLIKMAGGPTGVLDVVQGITKITPVWCSVEGLQLPTQSYVWEMRIATSSIPSDQLSAIINHLINPKDADQRLKVVRLYLQQERYADAEEELKKLIADFPDRANLKEVAKELKQLGARQILGDIETRSKAGQHQLIYWMLQNFPAEGVAAPILQQVRAKFDENTEFHQRRQSILKQLGDLTAAVKDDANRKRIQPLVQEISNEMSINTLDRMATYRRFADEQESTPEQKLALAISGWLLGANLANENIISALSHAELRDLIADYMRTDSKNKIEQAEILAKIKKQEFASPKVVAALLNKMPPVLELPEAKQPGLYELSVPSVPEEPDVTYYVQLPPEYDPHSSYPCVITLHGAGSTAEQQIEWWAGAPPTAKQPMRLGQASRHGYIVVAPAWGKPHQKEFESSAREHHAVLSVLRDACRYFAIDTDRIFLSGHSMGATAAWEIGLAHPDLWAGVIPIVPTVNNTIQRYWKNAEFVPLYFVGGEKDGESMLKCAPEFERYLNRVAAFDTTAVEFIGRGHEHFSDEILRIFDWMGRRRRDFVPRRFEVVTQRETDSFFWWVELQTFQPPPKPMQIESHLTANNGVNVQCGAKLIVWLSPEMVDFSRQPKITLNGRPMRGSAGVQPDVDVLLEDARSRGERKHPFWAKVE